MKKWTVEEVEYLQEHWGAISIPSIAKKLNRSIYAIKSKAYKTGLGRHIHHGEYVTFNQLIKAIGQKCNYSCYSTKLQNYGFPMRYRKSINKSYRVVYIEEFWKWAEQNQTKLDFSKFEKNMLGPEPEWAKIKRKNDKKNKTKYSTSNWTKEEDKKLQELLNQYKYSYRDLCKILKRTEGAIQRRICELKLKARPIKADNHTKWTQTEYEKLAEMIKERYDYNEISDILGRSSKAIRGRVYDMYLSENLDNVVKMMANGKWGHGRPQLNITHKKLNGEERKQVKKDLKQFLGILKGVIENKCI